MTDETLGSRRTNDEAIEDLTLATPVPETDDVPDIEDITEDLSEEDFDFGAFVEGARPTRRAVTVTMRADLAADMDILVERVAAAEKAGDTEEVEALVEEFEQVRAVFLASRRRVIVEGRSHEWLVRQEKIAEKEGVAKPGKKASDAELRAYTVEIMLRQIAGQIVHPTKGVTVAALRTLLERSEPELNKIWQACRQANTQPAQVVTPDFSRGR